jgi:hypothetical protein
VLTSALIRQALVPMLAGYLVIMTALGFGLRRLRRPMAADRPERGLAAAPPPGPRAAAASSRRGWLRLARHVAGTAVGGYLLLMAVVIAYYYGVARVAGDFIKSAFTGTAMLIGIALPLWGAASWLTERRRQPAPGRPRQRNPQLCLVHIRRPAHHFPAIQPPQTAWLAQEGRAGAVCGQQRAYALVARRRVGSQGHPGSAYLRVRESRDIAGAGGSEEGRR